MKWLNNKLCCCCCTCITIANSYWSFTILAILLGAYLTYLMILFNSHNPYYFPISQIRNLGFKEVKTWHYYTVSLYSLNATPNLTHNCIFKASQLFPGQHRDYHLFGFSVESIYRVRWMGLRTEHKTWRKRYCSGFTHWDCFGHPI